MLALSQNPIYSKLRFVPLQHGFEEVELPSGHLVSVNFWYRYNEVTDKKEIEEMEYAKPCGVDPEILEHLIKDQLEQIDYENYLFI